MDNKEKAKIALSDAIIQGMWIKGFITHDERTRIMASVDREIRTNC